MVAGFWLYTKSGLHLAVTTFILAGMTAGAVGAYAVFRRALNFFLFAALVPFIFILFIQPSTEYQAMGFMCLLYLILMTIIGHNSGRVTDQSIRLRFENEDLTSRMKDASHEIRTPVTAIAGFAELMSETPDCSVEVREFASIIHRNSLYLKNLIDNLLMYSHKDNFSKEDEKKLISLKEQMVLVFSIIKKRALRKI